MASLLDLLCAYPILEALVATLPLGDLLNLSKTNSELRAALHGFGEESLKTPSMPKAERPTLWIGKHNTLFWKNLKAKSQLCCSEPQHTKGDKIKGCLTCSMPVCEACIIKASFGKRDEDTFLNRTRSVCAECFNAGKHHQDPSLNGEENCLQISYFTRTECICAARDGHLCLRCKSKQNSSHNSSNNQCYGRFCSRSISEGFGGRICLWCDLPLPRERTRAESRRDYDARHLLARKYSSYDRSLGEVAENDSAEQEAVWISPYLTPSSSGGTTSVRKAQVFARDRFEDARKRDLELVSERRRLTASATEEERWRKSETLRRSEVVCLRTRATESPLVGPISLEPYLRSTASTNSTDDSSLPSYESCTQ